MTFLYVDSSKRSSGTISEPKVKFETISKSLKGCFSLKSAIVPYSFYQINSTNNTFRFQENGQGVVTSTITPGSYTVYTLATELTTQLDNDSPSARTYTVVYNVDQSTYTITGSAGTFTLDSSASFAPLIGFTADPDTASSQTSDQVVNINPTNYLFLKSNEISTMKEGTLNNLHSDSLHGNTLAKIAITGEFRDNIVYNNLGREALFPISGNLNAGTYSFYFTDKDNNVIDFQNVPFSLVFSVI